MTKPVIQLTACNYSDIGRNTPVLNKQQLDYYMYVYISPDVDRLATLFDVTEITGTYSAPALEGAFDKDSPCWIKVTTGLINLSPGKHTYKLSFVDTSDDSTFSQYVSYIIQDDNPYKPYIYMDRECECGHPCTDSCGCGCKDAEESLEEEDTYKC